MNTDELRERYLAFFQSKGCVRRPSDVLVPKDDPTVLFTPAGMNQFKNQFLGIGPLEFTKATTCQKCIRTGDIGNVGVTAYHHTFFEMLGNFSFGDYFKREAIHWAWEFLTSREWLALDPTRLTVTTYLDDDEAAGIWQNEIGLPLERIKRCDEYENFWPAGSPTNGPDGVCGPCSEIYYHPPSGGKEVEIWNLVFTQFNRVGNPPNNLRPLPKKNIDTGMGLERCAAVLQGVESNFEINTLRPLCEAAGDVVGVKYDFHGPYGRPLRRIADHVRAVTFCIHENCLPDNEKEGYIVRLLLRRACMEGYLLGRQEPFLYQLVPAVVTAMKAAYPELESTTESVANSIRDEERQFLGKIEDGIGKFRRLVDRAKSQGQAQLRGDDVFELHQTDGFLVELSESLAANEGLTIDAPRFAVLMEEHKKKSGRGAFAESVMAAGPLDELRQRGATKFVGYDQPAAESKVIGLIAQKQLAQRADAGQQASIGLVLDQTPFYGESGGQVGDLGEIVTPTGCFVVSDTQKDGDLIVHIGQVQSGAIEVGQTAQAQIDADRREALRRAHSCTHLLHHALRTVLGENATQRGSKVEPDQFRFDFAHPKGISDTELLAIEDSINAHIAQGAVVQTQVLPIADARKLGAMALFGEKYPDRVRVVSMGDFSVELCGGTHLSNTGQVGFCRILRDELIASGVRRMTCLTGPKALARVRETEAVLKEAAIALKAPQWDEVPRKIAALQEEIRLLKRDLAKYTVQSLATQAKELMAEAEVVGESRVLVRELHDVPRESLKEVVDRLRDQASSAAILLGLVTDGKVALIASVSKDLLSRGLSASEAVKTAAKHAGGGGGGRPDLAEAGAKSPEKIGEALAAGREYFLAALKSAK